MTLSAQDVFDYLELMRLRYGLITLALVYLAYTISLSQQYLTVQLLAALAAAFFVVSGSSVLDNYVDVELDLLNNSERALPQDRVKKIHALYFSIALFALATFLSAIAGLKALLISNLAIVAVVVYETFVKKNYPWLKIILPGLFASLVVLFGAVMGSQVQRIAWLAVSLFLALSIDTTIKELKSYVNKEERWVSLPKKIGRNSTALLNVAFTSLFVGISPLPALTGILGRNYLLIVAVADLLLLYAAVKILSEKHAVQESYKIERIGIFFFLLAWGITII